MKHFIDSLGALWWYLSCGLKRRLDPDTMCESGLCAIYEQCRGFDPQRSRARIIEKTRFVVIDTETTGLHAYAGDEIVSIALLEYRGFEGTGRRFETGINPQRPIPVAATAIHGIADEDVRAWPTVDDAFEGIMGFIGTAVLVGHHVNFDIRFLNKLMQRRLRCRLRNPWVDTMLLYLAYSGRMGHYTLEEVARRCNTAADARHSAAGDARTAARIFTHLGPRLAASGDTLGTLVDLQFEVGRGAHVAAL